MIDAHLAEVQINPADVPLTEADRRALIAWFTQMAEELARGEHWGSRVFALGRAKITSTNGKGAAQ